MDFNQIIMGINGLLIVFYLLSGKLKKTKSNPKYMIYIIPIIFIIIFITFLLTVFKCNSVLNNLLLFVNIITLLSNLIFIFISYSKKVNKQQ